MLQGAIIGVIVAIVMMIMRRNQQKKALAKVNNEDVIDQPDFAAFFHYASEETFNKKGLKFFDTNGAATLNGTLFNYSPEQKGKPGLSVDLKDVRVSIAPEKRKMKWIEIAVDDKKLYFTSFNQGAFSIDVKAMEEFMDRLRDAGINL
jgi:hypothetical protein